MDRNEMKTNALAMIDLVACALNDRVPEADFIRELDHAQLYEVSQKHLLTACVAYALESAGVVDDRFVQAKEKAIRKNILLDAERKKILARFEEQQIWYLPLKGILLKEWYPRAGMRQMADNDILCDETKAEEVRKIFEDEGYTCAKFGKGIHDTYQKRPVYSFEIHRTLFEELIYVQFFSYYCDVKQRLLPDEGSEYGYRFCDEDYYLYMLAHECKHFSGGGTGVRSLVDTYILWQRFGETFDRTYLAGELEKLGLTEFERRGRELAEKLFSREECSREELTGEEQEFLDRFIRAGSYGTLETKVENSIQRYGRGSQLRYVFFRFFPPLEKLKPMAPWVTKSPLLVPVAWVYRIFRGAVKNHKKLRRELNYLLKRKENEKDSPGGAAGSDAAPGEERVAKR